jgi:hypothetical protein
VKLLSLMILIAFPVMAQQNIAVPSALQLANPAIPAPDSSQAWKRGLDPAPSSNRALYRWSLATVLAANAADVASSWRNREANPITPSSVRSSSV